MQQVTLKLKVKHFVNVSYFNPEDCPVARAIKEQLGQHYTIVGQNFAYTNDNRFLIRYGYDVLMFNHDIETIRNMCRYNMWKPTFNRESVVREVILTKI